MEASPRIRVTGSRAVPIHQTTSYQFKDTEHAANLFALKEFGNLYTRLMNPTTDVFEKRLAALDGGVGALATASGQAAITLALLNIAQAGDEIVSADNLYGGTYNLFRHTFPRLGIKVHFVPSNDLGAYERAIGPKTKAVHAESIGNPKLDVTDLEALSRLAHAKGLHHQGARHAAARHGPGAVAVQLVPVPAGPRDAAPAHDPSLGERAGGREVARQARQGRVGELSGARVEPRARADPEVPAARRGRDPANFDAEAPTPPWRGHREALFAGFVARAAHPR
jgi:hypothetical protein